MIAFKVLTADQKDGLETDGIFQGAPIDLQDGYIHLSDSEQLAGTLDKHFSGKSDLFIAAVDLSLLGEIVRWEESRGGQLFPHIYGPLPLSAVAAIYPVERDSTGHVIHPPNRDDPVAGSG